MDKSSPATYQSHTDLDQVSGAQHGHCSSHDNSNNPDTAHHQHTGPVENTDQGAHDEHHGLCGHGNHSGADTAPVSDNVAGSDDLEKGADHTADHDGHGSPHCHSGSERPMFATVTVAVCHCGAGCVLGDIIGEWIVYGADVTINGRTLWPEYLIGKFDTAVYLTASIKLPWQRASLTP